MKEVKFRIDRFGCGTSENGTVSAEPCKGRAAGDTPASAKTAVQPVNVSDAGGRARWIIGCLIGSLLLAVAMFVAPATSSAQMTVGVSVSFGPPALPYYAQPPCPAPGYIWTPGYWAWDPAYGYYWVPGTWVPAPFVGALWTPGYWAYNNGMYLWYAGYWGPAVGYYGGINYGYGYTGYGYYGGYWNRGRFFYNRSVNRITITNITTVYNQRVVENVRGTRVSYYGGPGGTIARPTAAQLAAARERRFGAVGQQVQQAQFARTDRVQWASVNHGRPDVAATARPGEFRGRDVERATQAGAPYREPARSVGGREAERPAPSRAPAGRVTERAPSAPRYTTPPGRTERSAPARQMPERQEQRHNPPPAAQRGPERVQRPEARKPAARASQERHVPPPPPEKREGGHGHGG